MPFVAVGVPITIVGGLLAQAAEPTFLKGGYALLMLVLSVILLRHHPAAGQPAPGQPAPGPLAMVTESSVGAADARPRRRIVARDGTVYEYPVPRQGLGAAATGIGAVLTGMLSVGIGEVVMPQLVKRNRVPIPVAAATSVLTVIIVVAAASFTQITALIAAGGVNAVPWNLVIYTIPGVIIGGQIGPRLQGKVSHRTMERAIAILFFVIGVAMFVLVFGELRGR